ncbi:CDC42 small effector protein 2-A isoform X2 [Hydra vulgaris]|uniref:CDC42 small effector protein 2-A isoform X2 n=1 Tax=Hydra vulgaris TaxID=6087 RepID=A0ABM4CJQ0_HYDVU
MSLALLCFPCCVDEQPPSRKRPKIDRTQIGLPTNFQHTGHIGSGEVAAGFDVHQVQNSMQSKGGYEKRLLSSNSNTSPNLSNSNKTSPNKIDLTHEHRTQDSSNSS